MVEETTHNVKGFKADVRTDAGFRLYAAEELEGISNTLLRIEDLLTQLVENGTPAKKNTRAAKQRKNVIKETVEAVAKESADIIEDIKDDGKRNYSHKRK